MDLQEEIRNLKENAQRKKKLYQRTLQELKKLRSFEADELFHTAHETVFSEIDCLQCGNCCKTTPPLLLNEDINRVSKQVQQPVASFMKNFVIRDEDGDMVFNRTPCPFLKSDNCCSVYEARPNACREYPHTDRKKMQQILKLTLKNAEICPAVARILDNIAGTLAS